MAARDKRLPQKFLIMERLMADYSLKDNPFSKVDGEKVAQIENSSSYTLDDLIKLGEKEGIISNPHDFRANVEKFFKMCENVVSQGGNLNLPIVTTQLSIAGVFNGADDVFDAKRHALKINASAGLALKKAVGDVKLTKVEAKSKLPNITAIVDRVTNKVDSEVKIGSTVQLSGNRLRFDADDAEQGVFLVGDTGVKRCEPVFDNKPGTLLFVIPLGTEAGPAHFEVRSKVSGDNSKVKNMRIGVSKQIMVVS